MATNERIGSALNSGNLRADELHHDIEIVAALAFASRLGSTLQALRSAGHNSELQNSIELLSNTLIRAGRRKRIGIGQDRAAVIAQQALLEWMIRICKACNGTGTKLQSYAPPTKFNVPRRKQSDSCWHCNGTGLFMPSWKWRSQMMKLGPDESRDWWEKRIEFAKEIADDAYASARRKVTQQLLEMLE